MGSRALISSLIAIGFFLGAMGVLVLKPISVLSPEGEATRAAGKYLTEQEPKKKIIRTGRIRNHRSNVLGLMNFSNPATGTREQDSLLGSDLERKLNQLPDHEMDQKVVERFGNTKETRFIRFGVALELNDFAEIVNDQERQRMEAEYVLRLRTAGVDVFQKIQILVLDVLKGDAFGLERTATLKLLSIAAVENDFARMMIQDLVVRDFSRNPDQDFSKVATRYELNEGHPLYGVLERSFQRAPASVGAK